jgi:hypothetical protein
MTSDKSNSIVAPEAPADNQPDMLPEFDDMPSPQEIAARRQRADETRKFSTDCLNVYFGDRDLDVAISYVPPAKRVGKTDQEVRQEIIRSHQALLRNGAGVPVSMTHQEIRQTTDVLITVAKILCGDGDRDPAVIGGAMDLMDGPTESMLYQELATEWRDEVLVDIQPTERNERIRDFNSLGFHLAGKRVFPRPERTPQEIHGLFTALIEAYKTKYAYEQQSGDNDQLVDQLVGYSARNAMSLHDPSQVEHSIKLFQAAAKEEDPEFAIKFFETASRYAGHHGLDEPTTDALIANVLPRMRQKDSSVAVLNRGGNIWGMMQGDFGIANFVCHAYAVEVAPRNLHELLASLAEVPTTDVARLDRNRKDGLLLVGPFGILRDLIHDQRPYVHDVIEGMLEYHKTHNPEPLIKILNKTDYLGEKNVGYRARVLDLENYEGQAEEGTDNKDLVIDILERLEKNTRPIDQDPPVTGDDKMDSILQRVHQASSPSARRATVAEATEYANTKIASMMDAKQRGIEPDFVIGLSWLGHEQFKVMQSITFEDQIRLPKQAWFQDLLKFHELTHNVGYNQAEFSDFIEELQTKSDKEAFKMIAARVLRQLQTIAQDYNARGKTNWSEALWSGNTTHEFIGLVDSRRAASAVGRRLLAEQQRS